MLGFATMYILSMNFDYMTLGLILGNNPFPFKFKGTGDNLTIYAKVTWLVKGR